MFCKQAFALKLGVILGETVTDINKYNKKCMSSLAVYFYLKH